MLQTFTFSGAGRMVNAQAGYFRYEAGSAAGEDESIRVRADGQDLGTYLPGDSIRLPVAAVRWELTPLSAACTGTVRLGMGDVESARLVGRVSVVDEGALKTQAGSQFHGQVRCTAAGALFSLCGILAGAKRVAVKRLGIVSDTAGRSLLLYGTGAPTSFPGSQVIYNKRYGQASAQATRVTGRAAAQQPTAGELPGNVALQSVYLPANTMQELLLTTPIVLDPGYCLIVSGPAANVEMGMQFDVEELS